jgi:hypothetical protein
MSKSKPPEHTPCPHCHGKGYKPEMRELTPYGTGRYVVLSAKPCLKCYCTGVNMQHLLFTILKLDVKPVPPLKELGYVEVKRKEP